MHATWFSSSFLRFMKFPQIKEGRPSFLGEINSAEQLNYLVPILYFNFRNLKDPNSSLFIRFQSILHDSALLFSVIWNFLKSKKGDLISWAELILQNHWIIWSPLLYFNYRNLKNPSSSLFIRFQWILHHSTVAFSALWNFFKLKRGDIISWG